MSSRVEQNVQERRLPFNVGYLARVLSQEALDSVAKRRIGSGHDELSSTRSQI
jgi:hypothetical protein